MSVRAVHDFPSAIAGAVLALALGVTLLPLRSVLGPPVAAGAVAVSVHGLHLTVPDTEWTVGLGIVLVPVLLAHELAARHAAPPSAFALGTLLAWVAADSSRGRAGAAVAALACLTLIVLVVAAARLARTPTAPAPRAVVVLLIHGGAVLTCARAAGLREGIAAAALIALPVLLAVLLAETVVLRPRPEREPVTSPPTRPSSTP
jgi:hypothetical protein